MNNQNYAEMELSYGGVLVCVLCVYAVFSLSLSLCTFSVDIFSSLN